LEDDEIDADGVEEDDPESEESTNDVWG